MMAKKGESQKLGFVVYLMVALTISLTVGTIFFVMLSKLIKPALSNPFTTYIFWGSAGATALAILAFMLLKLKIKPKDIVSTKPYFLFGLLPMPFNLLLMQVLPAAIFSGIMFSTFGEVSIGFWSTGEWTTNQNGVTWLLCAVALGGLLSMPLVQHVFLNANGLVLQSSMFLGGMIMVLAETLTNSYWRIFVIVPISFFGLWMFELIRSEMLLYKFKRQQREIDGQSVAFPADQEILFDASISETDAANMLNKMGIAEAFLDEGLQARSKSNRPVFFKLLRFDSTSLPDFEHHLSSIKRSAKNIHLVLKDPNGIAVIKMPAKSVPQHAVTISMKNNNISSPGIDAQIATASLKKGEHEVLAARTMYLSGPLRLPMLNIMYYFSLTGHSKFFAGFRRRKMSQRSKADAWTKIAQAISFDCKPAELVDPFTIQTAIDETVVSLEQEQLAGLRKLLSGPVEKDLYIETSLLLSRPKIYAEMSIELVNYLARSKQSKNATMPGARNINIVTCGQLISLLPLEQFRAIAENLLDVLNSKTFVTQTKLVERAPDLFIRLADIGDKALPIIVAYGDFLGWPTPLLIARGRLGRVDGAQNADKLIAVIKSTLPPDIRHDAAIRALMRTMKLDEFLSDEEARHEQFGNGLKSVAHEIEQLHASGDKFFAFPVSWRSKSVLAKLENREQR